MTTELDICRERLVVVARRIVSESGSSPDFDAVSWVDKWLNEPLPALGTTPCDYILTGHSCEVLESLLLRAQSGAYS